MSRYIAAIAILAAIGNTAAHAQEAKTISDARAVCATWLTTNEALAKNAAVESQSANRVTLRWSAPHNNSTVLCNVDTNNMQITSIQSDIYTFQGEALQQNLLRVKHIKQVQAGDYTDFVQVARKNLLNDFKDPFSVKFRNVYISEFQNQFGGKQYTLCGEVNGKNTYGAYTGFKKFYAGSERGPSNSVDDGGPVFSRVFDKFCKTSIAVINLEE